MAQSILRRVPSGAVRSNPRCQRLVVARDKPAWPPQLQALQAGQKLAGKAKVQGERRFDFAHIHARQAPDQRLEARFVGRHDLIGHELRLGAGYINQGFAWINAFDVRRHRNHSPR